MAGNFDRSLTHSLLARENHDDRARVAFVVGLKRGLRNLAAGNHDAYKKDVLPSLSARLSRDPETVEEIGDGMSSQPFYRLWSTLSRSAQDIMWNTVSAVVEKDLLRVSGEAQRIMAHSPLNGSLNLDPELAMPSDILVADIHCQPGGYARNAGDADMIAGALYESGGNVYSLGTGIGSRDSKAAAVIRYLEERFPGFEPKRILDIGCSAGAASVAYAGHFPDAEVHAIDAGPAMLRYAHARAEDLGVPVHFHQMDAAHLKFDAESFDLIVSHNVMHEISSKTLEAMMAESRRVLRPGGITIHQDVPVRYRDVGVFERFMFSWETRFNNEPFWEVFAQSDMPAVMAEAGFDEKLIEERLLPKLDGPGAWYTVLAQKLSTASA